MQVTAILAPVPERTPAPEGGYNAPHPETGTVGQRETVKEGIGSLGEAVGLNLEKFPLRAAGVPTSGRSTCLSMPTITLSFNRDCPRARKLGTLAKMRPGRVGDEVLIEAVAGR
jgi:hypothetical protein